MQDKLFLQCGIDVKDFQDGVIKYDIYRDPETAKILEENLKN